MALEEIIDAEFEKYKLQNSEELKELKKSLRKMSDELLTMIRRFYAKENKYYSTDFKIDSLKDIGERYYSVIFKPIIYESRSYDIFRKAIWASFINPNVVNPLVDFDKFYENTENFYFFQDLLFETQIDKDQLVKELKYFYYYDTVSRETRHFFEESKELTDYIQKHLKKHNHVYTDFGISISKDLTSGVNFEEATIKQLFFDKLIDTFIDNINDRNINFNFAEQVYQDLYKTLQNVMLIDIDYQTFRTFLVIDNTEFKVKELEKYITISVENNNMDLKDVGYIFYDLSKKFKGNTKNFIKWIQLNFKWIKSDGSEASMTLNSLTKLLKPRNI